MFIVITNVPASDRRSLNFWKFVAHLLTQQSIHEYGSCVQSDSGEILIEATSREILDVLADVESMTEWSMGCQSSKVLERDAQGRPRRVKSMLKSGPITDEQVLIYTWHDDGVSWELESSKLQKSQAARYTLTALSDKTLVQFDISADPVVKMPAPVMRRISKLSMASATEGLRDQVMKIKNRAAGPGGLLHE